MRLESTRNKNISVSLRHAIFHGLADDGGLYLPKNIPSLPESFFQNLPKLTFQQVCFEVAKVLLQGEITNDDLDEIIQRSMTFDCPLVQIEKDIYTLELFHGPTLSFKDFGARFMAQLFHHYLKENETPLHILTATSGDTGSAVASGFLHVSGIKVWVLYPKGKISQVQEMQIATLGENITALAVDGTFDDCQRMVKEAFSDKSLRKKIHLTSANSINIARLIPQTFYYFFGFGQYQKKPLVYSVPCGNFGNLTAGILAKRMGLAIEKFVIATNINKVIPDYLKTGRYLPGPSKETLSNAMDVGRPSNFERMQSLYHQNLNEIKHDCFAESFTDHETVEAIESVYKKTGYIMDPHGAVAYLGLKAAGLPGIFLETAHPAKFQTPIKASMPKELKACLSRKNLAISIDASYKELNSLLVQSS